MRNGLGFSLYGLILHLTIEYSRDRVLNNNLAFEKLRLGISPDSQEEVQEQIAALEQKNLQEAETINKAKRELRIEQIRRQILNVEKSIESNRSFSEGNIDQQAVASRIEQLNNKLTTLRESIGRLIDATPIVTPPDLSESLADTESPTPSKTTKKKKKQQVSQITSQPQSSQTQSSQSLPSPASSSSSQESSSPETSAMLDIVYTIQQLLVSPANPPVPLRTPVLYNGDTWDIKELPEGAQGITNYAVAGIVGDVTNGVFVEESVYDHVTFTKYEDAQILPCGHSFSEEIAIQVDRCPDCRHGFTPEQLVPNTKLQEIADAFFNKRSKI